VSAPTPAHLEPRHWRDVHAFGLPDGSIRAVLAVAIFATIWVLLVRRAEHEVPDYLRDLMFIMMGHYFAVRRTSVAVREGEPGPLFLPRGTVRWILFAGFAWVGVMMFREGRFRDPIGNPGVVTLLLVVGFLLGVLVARWGAWRTARGHPTPRWVEDARAGVALVAAAVLVILLWTRMDSEPFEGSRVRLGPFSVENVMSAIVGFYFGSRS
jgi:hypothetical protein